MRGLPISAHLTQYGGGVIDLAENMDAIQWAISDQFGFESMAIQKPGTVDDVLYWFQQLGSAVVVYGPDAQICWEGYLNSVDATIGQETHSRSLDGMANSVKVRYTTVLGSPGVTSAVTNADSIARYGTFQYTERVGTITATAAAAQATRILNDRLWPMKRPSSDIKSGAIGDIQITFNFVGWYGALDRLVTTVSTTTNAVTTTQLTTLLTAYNATNNLFSTSATYITASGLSDTQYIESDTTYRAAIERLLTQGNSSGVRFAWGVYEGATFWVQTWAGATPTVPTYRRSLGDGEITYAYGGTAYPWDIRPNAMYEISELLDISPQATEVDAAARYYVARVSFSADASGVSVSLEPTDFDDVSAQLARLNRK